MPRLAHLPLVLLLSACEVAPAAQPPAGGYDLAFTQPSPQANYLAVTPGHPGASLPDPQQIVSRAFSDHLRSVTGCVRDEFRRTAVMGSHLVPAGYMVPVVCP